MLDDLKARLRIENTPESTLILALTHRSRSRESNNERLEFLGDAVLDLSVTELLMESHPEATEGEMSVRRARAVCEATLADTAREHDLGTHLRLGRGEAASGGADKDSLLADAIEAIIGAVFLENGYDEACMLVARLLGERLDEDVATSDPKTALQERAAEMGLPAPEYTHERHGPEHAPLFDATVRVGERAEAHGTGPSRKKAEQAAAHGALDLLRSRWETA